MTKNFEGTNYIGGKWMRSKSTNLFYSINPSNESILGEFPNSTSEEVEYAIRLAKDSHFNWKSLSRIKRAEYFWNLCRVIENKIDYISNLISLETGKNLNESKAETIEALHMAQYCFGKARESNGEIVPSELPERDCSVIRKSKGLIAVIAPWNFPFAIGGFWCAGPSLLEGNTVVFKPSELTPMVGQITAELFHEAGFPPGVFNLLHGDGNVGKKIVDNDLVDHICFTGSAEVGRSVRIACAESWHKTCSCEMGSKSAVIILDDADIDLSVSACINSAFKLSGQRCVSAGRILVQRNILEMFKEKFLAEVERCYVGDPFELIPGVCSVAFGPLISKEQKSRVQEFNDMVLSDKDCNILYYPIGPAFDRPGYFLPPLVYQCEWSDKKFLKQEVFGPHVAIIPFDTLQDAVEIYNDTEYGLSLGVITNNFKNARYVRDNCDFGLGYWNGGSIAAESHLPFGGVKKSGNGNPSAAGLFDNIIHKVSWTVNHGDLSFPQGLK